MREISIHQRFALLAVVLYSCSSRCNGYVIPPTIVGGRKLIRRTRSKHHQIIQPINKQPIRLRLPPITAKKDSNDNDDDKNDSTNPFQSFYTKIQTTLQPITQNEFVTKITKNELITKLTTTLTTILPTLKLTLTSFTLGIILTLSVIFVPLLTAHGDGVNGLEKNVALFETILADLERGYVDEINTKKLFETGVSAMLRSLDPYTEYYEVGEEVKESVSGKYGGIGLVISGETKDAMEARERRDAAKDKGPSSSSSSSSQTADDDDDEDDLDEPGFNFGSSSRLKDRGIRVANAFEGYAYDYGMRVGDKLLSVDSKPITSQSVEDVRNMLRGDPGTDVTIRFVRDGVEGEQEVTIPRRVVKIRDVQCAALFEDVGYVQLTGFSQEAGLEMRRAIYGLQDAMLEKTGGDLKGLILDLRNNPGGLLTSAVDVSSLFVPPNSDIVSARGRGFPGVLYRSRAVPILSPNTKLVVLTNSNTASAAEIVSGAVQDSDSGVIIGSGRTYGKGLVQNVEELPFDSALKFTVAKYYTPSGRCIQSTNYKEGGGLKENDARFISEKVKNANRQIFYTTNGRQVKDGGGIEADFVVPTPQASALEVTLLRSGIFNDFAAEWSKTNVLTDSFEVSESLYKDFITFCLKKQQAKDLKLEALYAPSLDQLHKVLKQSGYTQTERELNSLQASILREVENDFFKYKKDIKEDIAQNILARYLPDSMLIERGAKNDLQVDAAMKLIRNDNKYDKLLARDTDMKKKVVGDSSLNTARREEQKEDFRLRLNLKW